MEMVYALIMKINNHIKGYLKKFKKKDMVKKLLKEINREEYSKKIKNVEKGKLFLKIMIFIKVNSVII